MAANTESRLEAISSPDPATMDIVDYKTFGANWYGRPGHLKHDLLCSEPGCREVLMKGWTFPAAQKEFSSPLPKVALCCNGHYSVLPCNLPSLSQKSGFE